MADPVQGLLDYQAAHLPPASLPVLPARHKPHQVSRSSISASVQHADLQALLVANESLHQQLLLALQKLADFHAGSGTLRSSQSAQMHIESSQQHSEDIARWESGAPALMRANGTLQNDNVSVVEVEFAQGPLGLLFRPAPADTGYALEVHDFVQIKTTHGDNPPERQVVTQQEWMQQHPSTLVRSTSSNGRPTSSVGALSASAGSLQRGMVLTAIQGRDLFRVSQETVGDMLESSPRPLLLKFVLFPLSSLRRAYEALQSRFTTLQVRVEVMQSAALQREEVFQSELHRMKAQLRFMASSWRQEAAAAAEWRQAAKSFKAQLTQCQAQVESLEKRVPAPQDRFKAMMQREGASARGIWAAEELLRQASSRRTTDGDLAAGLFADLDAAGSFDHTMPPPPPSALSRMNSSMREPSRAGSDLRLGSQQASPHAAGSSELTRLAGGPYAGTEIGDSLLLVKARLAQLANERDSALRAAADAQEVLQETQQKLDAEEKRTAELREDLQHLQQRSDVLSTLGDMVKAEQQHQEQYLIKLAQNRFVQNDDERPDWGMALAAMRTLWRDFTHNVNDMHTLHNEYNQVVRKYNALLHQVDSAKRKLIALRAHQKRQGTLPPRQPQFAPSKPAAPKVNAPKSKPKLAAGSDSKAARSPSAGGPSQQRPASVSPKPPQGPKSPPRGEAKASQSPTPVRAEEPSAPKVPPANKEASSPKVTAAAPPPAAPSVPPPAAAASSQMASGEDKVPQHTEASPQGSSPDKGAAAAAEESVASLARELMLGGATVLEAAMSKRSRSGPKRLWSRWASRYVRLSHGMLSYYADDLDTRPKGSIEVNEIMRVVVCPTGSTGSHKAVFECSLRSGKQVQLAATSGAQCMTWRDVLGQAMVLASARQPGADPGRGAGGAGSDSDSDAST